ncbi:MAG: tetratricopeptide repeat protein [Bacteroidota bacterium]
MILRWLLLLFLSYGALGQSLSHTDSLIQRLPLIQDNEEKIAVTLELSQELLKNNHFLALEYGNQSIQLAKKIKSDSLLARAYINQGNTYLNLGNYARAMNFYQNAIQQAQQISDRYIVAVAQGNVGSIYYYQRDHTSALTYYLKALEYFKDVKSGDERKKVIRKANILNNIGIVYEETKKFADAAKYYDEALILARQVNEHEILANVLNNQGTMYRDVGRLELARQRYFEALEIRRKSSNKLGLARSYHNIGSFYLEFAKDLSEAERYFKQAIPIGTEIGAWETVSSSYENLYRIYQQRNNHKAAVEALECHMQLNDSLFNEESTRKIAQLEMQFEFERKQAAFEAQQKEKELYFGMAAGGLILLLIIATLLFFLQRSKTKRSQLEQAHLELEKATLKNDLQLKDKELATNIMYLLNKNELINNISEKLLEIKQSIGAESQGAMQKVVIDLQSNLQPELWQEFEFRFQQVHEHFYKTLNEKFPDLTPSEVRLCAFLKLNMTTKEISAITHQNAKSIDVARTRLRKKLNLTGTDHNLVTFLAQLDKA